MIQCNPSHKADNTRVVVEVTDSHFLTIPGSYDATVHWRHSNVSQHGLSATMMSPSQCMHRHMQAML